jgi:hypothetical protein
VTLIARRHSVRRRAVQLGAAAALVVASVGLGSIFGALGSGGSHSPIPKSQLRPEPIVWPAQINYAKPLGVRDVRPAVQRVARRGLTLMADDF